MINRNFKKTEDRIFYNITFNNNNLSLPHRDQIIESDETRSDEIMKRPSDYYFTISRFDIPALALPIVQMIIQPRTDEYGFNVDPNKSIFSFTLEYDGTIQQEYLIFAPTNLTRSPPPVPNIGGEWAHTDYYYVFSYEHMLGMFNATLETAFTNLAVKPIGAVAPYFQLDPQTGIMSLVCEYIYYASNVAIPIKLYMNRAMFKFLSSFNIQRPAAPDATDGRDFQFVINDIPGDYYNPPNLIPTTPPEWLKIDGVGTSYLQTWYTFKQIIFTTGTIPVSFENIEFEDLSNMTNTSTGDKTPILTDFQPSFNLVGESRSVLQYFPQGPYRLLDLDSEIPLTRLQISVFWRDEFNLLRRLEIPWGTLATVKMLFIKKGTQN